MFKILLVEDDLDLQNLMTMKLKMEGFEVMQAQTGQEAFEQIKNKPDLVLLDILLPDIDGITILNEIATNEATRGLPVIILSNLADRASFEQTEAIGKYEYLVKSKVDLDTVIRKIRERLEK